MSKSINEWAREVHQLAQSKGWHPTPMVSDDSDVNADSVGAKVALIHSEVSEALDELRNASKVYELHMRKAPNGKPEGFEVELADAIIRILDLSEALGLDIQAAMEAKHVYNATRPHRHGGKTL